MKIFKHLEGVFYYTQERHTFRWYPERRWCKEIVREPVGNLLSEGPAERVMKEVKEVIPQDLHEVICGFYQISEQLLVQNSEQSLEQSPVS